MRVKPPPITVVVQMAVSTPKQTRQTTVRPAEELTILHVNCHSTTGTVPASYVELR